MAKSRQQLKNELSFEVGFEEMEIIDEIVTRAVALARQNGVNLDRLTTTMDVTACHANGTPLRLRDLLAADNGNFGHDVFGIIKYIDRETGHLTDCFLPRFARMDGR